MSTKIHKCGTHGDVVHVISTDGRYRCRPCRVDAVHRRRQRVKQMSIEYLGGCCSRCGYKRYNGALEFHHRNPAEKDFEVSASLSWDKIQLELDKCDLLCSNCHREVHEEIRTGVPY